MNKPRITMIPCLCPTQTYVISRNKDVGIDLSMIDKYHKDPNKNWTQLNKGAYRGKNN